MLRTWTSLEILIPKEWLTEADSIVRENGRAHIDRGVRLHYGERRALHNERVIDRGENPYGQRVFQLHAEVVDTPAALP